MRIIVVDDEPLVLVDSVEKIQKACPGADIVTAENYREALGNIVGGISIW